MDVRFSCVAVGGVCPFRFKMGVDVPICKEGDWLCEFLVVECVSCVEKDGVKE